MEGSAHVSPSCEVEEEKQFLRGLESEFKADYEGVAGVSEHVAFSLGVLDEVVPHYLFLVKDFHCVEIARFELCAISSDV